MSEQGWQGFLAAEGVEYWVVLHGGATAVFRVGSVREAAQLAEAVAAVPLEGSGTLLTIADARLTVRLSRDLWQRHAMHIDVSVAREQVEAARGGARRWREHRRRFGGAIALDARRPRRRSRLHLRVARQVRPAMTNLIDRADARTSASVGIESPPRR